MGFADDLEKIKQAGYTSNPTGSAQQILNVIGQVPDQVRAQQEKAQQDETEQVKLYNILRESGYSKEDATDRVNRSHRSTQFIQKLLTGGKQNAFQPPTEPDKAALDTQKTQADIGKTKAETVKAGADATKSLAQADRMKSLSDMLNTPGATRQAEQLRKSLKDYVARTYPGIAAGYGTDEEQSAMTADPYVQKLQDALNKSLNLPEDKPTTKTQPDNFTEGTIIKNKATGKRMIRKNGQWQPL